MPLRTVGEIIDGTDFSDAILTPEELAELTGYDAEGDRGTRYSSIEEAVNAARESGIDYVVLIVEYGEDEYGLSFQYESFA